MTIVHMGPPHFPVLYTRGGATERRMRETAIRQAQGGNRVLIYSAEDRAQSFDHRGTEIRAIECRRQGLARAAEFMIKSLRDVCQHRPDVIHFHSLAEGAAFAKLFARGSKAKTVLSFDYYLFRRGKQNPFFPWYRRALKSFAELLPVSDYCKRESASYWSIPETRMRVLHNGVNLEQFAPDRKSGNARRAALGISQQETVLLYVGRVCEQKGSDLLLEAYARLRAGEPRLRLVVAGPIGQFNQEGSDDFARALGKLQGIYLGPVEEDILASVYNMADVFVLPTRSNEMFGMAAIEAQACGVPVVCSNHGGLPEVIGKSGGLMFETGNVDDLARQLRVLIGDPALRSRLQGAALSNAKRFAWEAIAAQLQVVYAGARLSR